MWKKEGQKIRSRIKRFFTLPPPLVAIFIICNNLSMEFSNTDITKVFENVNAPAVKAQISTLGGAGRHSLMITMSLDKREDWVAGILHNSRYMFFSLSQGGKLEQFNRAHTIEPKFRTRTVGSVDDAIAKINTYIEKVKDAPAAVK